MNLGNLSNTLLLATALTFTSCTPKQAAQNAVNGQKPQSTSFIINGVPVSTDNILAKSTVGLFYHYAIDYTGVKIWMQNCTGSVLAKKFILTAAHCVDGQDPQDIAINFSLKGLTHEIQANEATRITDLESNFVVRYVKALAIHPDYDRTGDHDLAVLLLADEIPVDAIPVQFLPDSYLNWTDLKTTLEGQTHQVTLLGFGITHEDFLTEAEVLRTTTVPARFEDNFVITDQTGGSGGCNGDSGGPAFLKLDDATYQVGVTHGPYNLSTTCHEEGQWVNPALDKNFLDKAQSELLNGPFAKADQNSFGIQR